MSMFEKSVKSPITMACSTEIPHNTMFVIQQMNVLTVLNCQNSAVMITANLFRSKNYQIHVMSKNSGTIE